MSEVHLQFMDLTVQFLALAARSNGPMTKREFELIKSYLRDRYAHDLALHNRAMAFLSQYESDALDVGKCLECIFRDFRQPHRAVLIDSARLIVSAAGEKDRKTIDFLMKAARRLGVTLSPQMLLRAELPPSPSADGQTGTTIGQKAYPSLITVTSPTDSLARPAYHVIMELTVQFAVGIAQDDGVLSFKEAEIIRCYLKKRYGYNLQLHNEALVIYARCQCSAVNLTATVDQIVRSFSVEHRQTLMELAADICAASGRKKRESKHFLKTLSVQLELPAPRRQRKLRRSPVQTKGSQQPLKATAPSQFCSPDVMNLLVLEIDPSIPLTSELVRRQYNQIRGRYRIEKLEKMGPEIVSIGRTKCEELLRAATSLMEKLGESLELHSEPTLPRDLRHNPDLDDVFGV